MNYLEIKIKEIDYILNCISDSLNIISEENFDLTMGELNNNLQKLVELKQELKTKYNYSSLEKFEPGLDDLTKQIHEKFDNIINVIKSDQAKVKTEISNIQNKKKLTNYNR